MSFIPPPSNVGYESVARSGVESDAAAKHHERAHGDVLAPRGPVGRLADRLRSALSRTRARASL